MLGADGLKKLTAFSCLFFFFLFNYLFSPPSPKRYPQRTATARAWPQRSVLRGAPAGAAAAAALRPRAAVPRGAVPRLSRCARV